MNDHNIYDKANKKVRAKKSFLFHFLAYIFIVGLLSTIVYQENNGEMLPVIIVGISWGLGLLIHYFMSFGTEHLGFLGISEDWEEDELEKEVDRLERIRELKERIVEEERMLDEYDRLELKELERRPNRDEY